MNQKIETVINDFYHGIESTESVIRALKNVRFNTESPRLADAATRAVTALDHVKHGDDDEINHAVDALDDVIKYSDTLH